MLVLLLIVVVLIIEKLYWDKVNNIICKWYWDYAAIEYKLCKRYEIYRKIVSFAYDFDKTKKIAINLTIAIEVVTCFYRFIKICYAENWIC
nr:MAG TPA: hypothetical protein [Caudoviricetes sp.]